MTTTADSTTYGSISNAPGKRTENQQTNKVHTTANVSDGTTTTTTVAASYGSTATAVGASATVDAAEAAIRTVRRARTNPTALRTAKVTGTATRFETGHVSTVGTRVNGSGYTNGTYSNIALVGGSGTGATANITVSGGAVTAASIVRGGNWYTVGDVLTCNLIGSGTLFALPVTAITMG
jgi:flavin-binding protein dodecin